MKKKTRALCMGEVVKPFPWDWEECMLKMLKRDSYLRCYKMRFFYYFQKCKLVIWWWLWKMLNLGLFKRLKITVESRKTRVF